MPEPISEQEFLAPITEAEAQSSMSESEMLALKVVMGDITKAEQYIQSKRLPATWNDMDDLFRAYTVART